MSRSANAKNAVKCLLGLAGGVVLAVAPAEAGPSTWDGAETEIAACFAAMDRDPTLAEVNAKFARRDPTEAQRADRTLASAQEAEALRLRVKKTRPCRALRLAAVQEFHPLLEPAYRTLYYQADQVFEYLTNRWIAYGTANRLSSEALAMFQGRSRAYFAAGDAERGSLAQTWDEELQRAHSNPPPSDPGDHDCRWDALNIVCR